MSLLVIILNQDTKECDPNIRNLQEIFNHDFYHVKIMNNYREALKYAHTKYCDIPTLVIKDNSVILYDIQHCIKKILNIDADLHFLCNWGDSCHQYRNVIDGVKWSNDAYASQAVIYMPHCRKDIIKKLKKQDIEEILKMQEKKTVFIPNIVHFDIDLAKSNQDFLKLNIWKPIVDNNEEMNNQLIWVFIFIIIIILLSILIPYYKKYKHI